VVGIIRRGANDFGFRAWNQDWSSPAFGGEIDARFEPAYRLRDRLLSFLSAQPAWESFYLKPEYAWLMLPIAMMKLGKGARGFSDAQKSRLLATLRQGLDTVLVSHGPGRPKTCVRPGQWQALCDSFAKRIDDLQLSGNPLSTASGAREMAERIKLENLARRAGRA
jgi:hypothetical protein